MNDEIFDIVDEHDQVIGQATRREVHTRGLWHRAIHVLVVNAAGNVFLQKRSLQKDTAAGLWDSSSSGHLDTGEAYEACAVRELREELGLVVSHPLAHLFKINACRETGWEFCQVFQCASEGPFTLHPEEIETGAWFAPEQISAWVSDRPQDFASAFVLIWNRWQNAPDP